jgi:transposase
MSDSPVIWPPCGQVFLAVGATDMRKSINGLSILVEQAIQDIRGIAVCAFYGHAVKRSVIIGHKRVKFDGEIPEFGAVGLLEDLSV